MPEERGKKRDRPARSEHFLKPRPRSTPCVGICSTSHGDFVCRGCKRFFNEVRDWQNFAPDQREMVFSRLAQLKRDSILALVGIASEKHLRSKTDEFVGEDCEDLALRIYEALARCEGVYAEWGLHPPKSLEGWQDPINVLKHIEDFYYETSRGAFEQFYKIRAN